ncbi:MAG: hypothetical protein KGL10_02205 [Alphaproteobacteria bacterium]|nr:hypothetical protein [Alphaproteobacteria bacterium]MDE2336102.1 hypothetical protein [Alphaproteobacteria bacterium]
MSLFDGKRWRTTEKGAWRAVLVFQVMIILSLAAVVVFPLHVPRVAAERLAKEDRLVHELRSGKRQLSAFQQAALFQAVPEMERQTNALAAAFNGALSNLKDMMVAVIVLLALCLWREKWLICHYRDNGRGGGSGT